MFKQTTTPINKTNNNKEVIEEFDKQFGKLFWAEEWGEKGGFIPEKSKIINFIFKALADQKEKELSIMADSILQSKAGWIEQGKEEAKQQIAEEIEGMKETDLSNFKVCKDSRNCQFGYNQALSDILTNLKKNKDE